MKDIKIGYDLSWKWGLCNEFWHEISFMYKHKAIICQLEYFQITIQVVFGNIKARTQIFYTLRPIFYTYQ